MRFIPVFILLAFMVASCSQSIQKLHERSVLIDTHNDLLSSQTLEGRDISYFLSEGHSDLPRLKIGGVDVQFFSVWTGDEPRNPTGFFADANQEIDSLEFITLRNLHRMVPGTSYKAVKKGIRENKLVAMIGVEGGHMIEEDLAKLESLYYRGMRYMTLTWNNSVSWASSARDETERPDSIAHKGLNDFGKQVVRKMNELGVIVDLSHVGEQTFYDALAVTSRPVLLSHSSVYSICPHFRNLKDEQIRAVAANGGVICINFYSGFIDSAFANRTAVLNGAERTRVRDSLALLYEPEQARMEWRNYYAAELEKLNPGVEDVVDHIDYIVKLVGDDHVGIGADYDGVNFVPKGLEDTRAYPRITEELKRRGYSKKSIRKILGKNVLRVMKDNFRE